MTKVSFVIYLSTIVCDGKMDNFKGSTCQVSCDPSYELNGDTEIECTGGGKNWSWNKDWPQCDPGMSGFMAFKYSVVTKIKEN